MIKESQYLKRYKCLYFRGLWIWTFAVGVLRQTWCPLLGLWWSG